MQQRNTLAIKWKVDASWYIIFGPNKLDYLELCCLLHNILDYDINMWQEKVEGEKQKKRFKIIRFSIRININDKIHENKKTKSYDSQSKKFFTKIY